MTGAPCVVALDVGGTAVKGGLVDVGGGSGEISEWPTPRVGGGSSKLDTVVRVARQLCADARAQGRMVRALGVAAPGLVDEAAGFVRLAVNLEWRDVPLRRLMADELDLPVTVSHDVRSAARAEMQFGAGRGRRDTAFIVVSTGICAAFVRDGAVDAGAHGLAGELGHVVVDQGGRPCPCGRRGCLETIASARAVERDYAQITGLTLTAEEIVGRLPRDRDARNVVDSAVGHLATAVANLAALVDPDVIIMGGGFSRCGDVVLQPIREALQSVSADVDVTLAELGNAAGCIGAGLAAWQAAIAS